MIMRKPNATDCVVVASWCTVAFYVNSRPAMTYVLLLPYHSTPHQPNSILWADLLHLRWTNSC